MIPVFLFPKAVVHFVSRVCRLKWVVIAFTMACEIRKSISKNEDSGLKSEANKYC